MHFERIKSRPSFQKIIGRCPLLLLLLLAFLSPVYAQDSLPNVDVGAVSEEIMESIYQEILSQQPSHPELSNFTLADSQWKNNFGLRSIIFRSDALVGENQINYGFQLTILPTKEILRLPTGYKPFNLGFPVLDLKITGYQNMGLPKNLYNIQEAIQKYGIKLWEEQQKYLPYKLSLKPAKESFRVGEDIEFTVNLVNDSKVNYKLKGLNSNTLYFVFDNKPWGAQELDDKEAKNMKELFVKPGQVIQKKFRAPGFRKPQTIDVYVTYNFPYKGVKPSAKLTFTIVE